MLNPGAGSPTAGPNDASVVLHVRYGEFDLLLTGDVSVFVEARILDELGPVEVLKVAHHGSQTSTGGPFLARVRPRIATISAGRDNRFGHPHPQVVARLKDAGATILRTDRHGDITIVANDQGETEVTLANARRFDP